MNCDSEESSNNSGRHGEEEKMDHGDKEYDPSDGKESSFHVELK